MGKNWGIVIGINNYYNLKALKYAQSDAEAFRDFCLNDADFEEVYFFAEGAEPIRADRGTQRAEPSFGNLDYFLQQRFDRARLEPGDNLWFFFAGHGRREQGRDYLMPIDANPNNVAGTGIAIGDIAALLRLSGADNILLILDACRSEDGRDGGEGIGIEKQQGVITLFSCVPSKSAYEIEELEAGSFTYALIEGLRLQGEGNCATVERLSQHLRYRVPELNQRYNKPRQDPYVVTEPASKLHLILLPQYATLQDVLALKNDALEAEAEANLDLAEQLWTRVLAASPADRQAIKAIQRIALRKASQPPNLSQTLSVSDARDERASRVVSRRSESIFQPAPEPPPKPAKPMLPFEVVRVNDRGQEIERRQGEAEYRREDLGQGVSLDLMKLPSGDFMMGSSESELERSKTEGPQHRVNISSFWMGKYPVTQAQWKAVAALAQVERDLDPDPARFKGGDRPVEKVSWHDAVEFCARLSQKTGREYRLPSEAEWEYACRSGTAPPFHFGETITSGIAHYRGTVTYGNGPKGKYREETTVVGSFKVANSFGLYDLHGNVWEWCLDYSHDSYEGAPTDGSAWTSGGDESYRMLRGGSWIDNPGVCRSAVRLGNGPDSRCSNVGFRVVCSTPWEA